MVEEEEEGLCEEEEEEEGKAGMFVLCGLGVYARILLFMLVKSLGATWYNTLYYGQCTNPPQE